MLCSLAFLFLAQVIAMEGLINFPEDSDLLALVPEREMHMQGDASSMLFGAGESIGKVKFDNSTWFRFRLPKHWPNSLQDMTRRHDLHILLVPVLIGFALLLLVLSSLVDWRGLTQNDESDSAPNGEASETLCLLPAQNHVAEPKLQTWSKVGILCLTSYRFYTGFLSATWMPYLLAMEGHALMGKSQSFFMGTAKLIYGLSIMMNPMFGLVGDRMAVISHWSGRRVFVLMGVAAGGLGIYGCIVSAQIGSIWWYLAAVVLWMLGEAMADVTTETLVPELLPRSQYDIGATLRAVNFLVGGLVGYSTLIMFRDWHYSWLYYGYLLVMMVCAFLTLCFIHTEDLVPSHPRQRKILRISRLVEQAYLQPARLEGGFPKACLCLFVFSLGTAPMFFLLLMVRDLIGISDQKTVQLQFSIISIVFFISAALATVLEKLVIPAAGEQPACERRPVSEAEAGAGSSHEQPRWNQRGQLVLRWRIMVFATLFFGGVAFAMPFIGLLPNITLRTVCFYIIAVFFGGAFGSVYSRFQECTWSILPQGIDVANAMGFAAMCKLAGVGVGNFLAGIILDVCNAHNLVLSGYFIMCTLCSVVVTISAKLAHEVAATALKAFEAK